MSASNEKDKPQINIQNKKEEITEIITSFQKIRGDAGKTVPTKRSVGRPKTLQTEDIVKNGAEITMNQILDETANNKKKGKIGNIKDPETTKQEHALLEKLEKERLSLIKKINDMVQDPILSKLIGGLPPININVSLTQARLCLDEIRRRLRSSNSAMMFMKMSGTIFVETNRQIEINFAPMWGYKLDGLTNLSDIYIKELEPELRELAYEYSDYFGGGGPILRLGVKWLEIINNHHKLINNPEFMSAKKEHIESLLKTENNFENSINNTEKNFNDL